MKKIYTIAILAIATILLQSSIKKLQFSGQPPQGYTGATGTYCTACHSTFSLNSGGGSVLATGLPVGSYIAGQAYEFSITINHGSANRTRWGFSIRAVNGSGQDVGSFSSSNANAAPNGNELGHNSAVSTGSQSSYIYTDLRWTAPSSPSALDQNVTFYYVGNAADGGGTNRNDYIYSNVLSVVLPVDLKELKAITDNKTVTLNWQTASEANSSYFEIERSNDAQKFDAIGRVAAAGNSAGGKSYTYTDTKPGAFETSVFYRLKMTDKDGKFRYSTTVSVKLKASQFFVTKLYPSVISQQSALVNTLIISDKAQTLKLQLLDISGRKLEEFNISLVQGANQVSFTPSVALGKGWLFARFMGEGLQQTLPLFVK